MQSGIAASTELRDAFRGLLSDESHRGLLVGISKSPEALVPRGHVPSTHDDFLSDLANLTPLLKGDEALYVIARQTTVKNVTAGSGSFVAITYVPDRAPVRQKMLFASTRLTLVRELGNEYFASSFFITEAEELSAEGWIKHEAHTSKTAPLTEEERNLQGIREAEAHESTGTGARRSHVSSHLQLPVANDALSALKRFKAGHENLIQLHVNVGTEMLVLASSNSISSPSEVAGTISKTQPQFTFYRYPDAAGSTERIVFVYSCPSSSSIKEKMLGASSRARVIALARSEVDVVPIKSIEISEPEDLDELSILDGLDIGARIDGNGGAKRFNKPKRPGRR